MAKVQIVFYSMYGHVHAMAEAVAAGAREVDGCQLGSPSQPKGISRPGDAGKLIDSEWITQTRRAAISVSGYSHLAAGFLPETAAAESEGTRSGPRARENTELRLPIQTTGSDAIAKVDSSLFGQPQARS
jgi:hypothetical protein